MVHLAVGVQVAESLVKVGLVVHRSADVLEPDVIEECGGVWSAVLVLLEAHFNERDGGSADLRREGVIVGIALAYHLLERVSIVC